MKCLLLILLAGSLLFGQTGCASRSYNYASFKEEQATANNYKHKVDTSDWSNVLQLGADESIMVTRNNGAKVKGLADSVSAEFIVIMTPTQAKNQIACQDVQRVEKIVKDSPLTGAIAGSLAGVVVGSFAHRQDVQIPNPQLSNEVAGGNNKGSGLSSSSNRLMSLNQPTEILASRKPVDDLGSPFSFDWKKMIGFMVAGAIAGTVIDGSTSKVLIYKAK